MHGRLGLAGLWGIAGVLALLGQAIARLTPFALEALEHGLSAIEAVVLCVWTAISAYAEGYRGFQRQFSPRVIARALHLQSNPRRLYVALAPLYCIGLVHATRKRLITSWTLTLTIVTVVLVVRHVPQPWRGIIDVGVVLGISWGVIALVFYLVQAMRGRPPGISPDVP